MPQFENLFSPIRLGSLEIRNRFVVPAMATTLGNEDGTVSQALIDYWVARAKGGWGLLIVENTAIDPLGKVGPREPCLWSADFVPGFQRLTDAVHSYGAKIAIQISHAGRQTFPEVLQMPGTQPVSASPIPCPLDRTMPRELSSAEVYELIGKYGDAAGWAREAGFDAVEVHGAHGYLLAQFMSAYSNKRTDEFGGSLRNRMRFTLEVIKTIRQRVGPSYPLLFRMSGEERVPGGRTLDESRVIARLVQDAGIDVIDVSVGVSGSGQFIISPAVMPPGFLLSSAQEVKKAVTVPVIAVGRINDPLLAEDAILCGKADLIAWGRSSLADPQLPNKIASGQFDDICPCIACVQGCTLSFPVPGQPLSKAGVTCLVNPFCAKEEEMRINPTDKPKQILVIGGGPAGLEASWIAAARGHKVTLFEKNSHLGGQYRIAAIPPFKQDITRAISYYVHTCEKYSVQFRMETEATTDEIVANKPDAVILATGSEPAIPDIKGIDGKRVVSAWDILTGKTEAGPRVLIIGGGMVGCEVADFLGEHFHQVTLIARSDIALDVPAAVKYFLLQRLSEYRVQIERFTPTIELLEDGAVVSKNGSEFRLEGFDTIVLALGRKSVDSLKNQLGHKIPELYVIGDAREPRQALEAIREGAEIGLKI